MCKLKINDDKHTKKDLIHNSFSDYNKDVIIIVNSATVYLLRFCVFVFLYTLDLEQSESLNDKKMKKLLIS